jgi:hypothetical protein
MKKVAYTGRSDARILGPEDFKKAGVDTDKSFTFQRRIATEVTNEIAKALTEHTRLFGPFEETDAAEGQRFDAEQLDFSSIESESQAGEVLDTPQTGVDTPTATTGATSTGRTSTRSSR